MTIVLALIAFACIVLIVWSAPGVWKQYRRDVRWRRLAREWLRVMAAFERLNLSVKESADAIERFADLIIRAPVWAEEGEAEWVS